MIQLLLHIIIVSVICIIWGIPFYFFIRKKVEENCWFKNGINLISLLFFSGLLTISFFSSWLILFIPLKFIYLFFPTILLALLIGIRHRKEIKEILHALSLTKKGTTAWTIFIFSGILLLLVLGTLKPVNPDTQLYHLQLIRWTNEYGVVPGIANIYPRLGLGSNWFNLISFFHIPSFSHQNFTYLNTTVAIWFLLWLTGKWHYYTFSPDYINGKVLSVFYSLITAYFIIDWQLLRDTANSTAYDFIVTILIFLSLSYFVEKILKKEDLQKHSLFFIFISLSVTSFKLSGLLIFIFIFLAIVNEKSSKLLFKTFLLLILIVTPVLIKNHITSGYILYPSAISIGNPGWQMPAAMTEHFKDYIVNVNRYYNHEIGMINSLEKNNFNWIPYWFSRLLLRHKILLGLSFFSILLIFYSPLKNINIPRLRQLVTGIWVMIAAWFFMAPDPRFAFGFILVAAFLPLAINTVQYITSLTYPILLMTLSAGMLLYTFFKATLIIEKSSYILYPVQNDIPPFSKSKIQDVSFTEPKKINENWNNRCFYIPLPCLCEKNPYLKPRGTKLSNGFIMKQPDSNFILQYNY
jgi:hypothetical protein